jgi:hypothetical protein
MRPLQSFKLLIWGFAANAIRTNAIFAVPHLSISREELFAMMYDRPVGPDAGSSFFIYFSSPLHTIPPGPEYITCVVDAPGVIAERVAAALWGKKVNQNNL